MAKTGERLWFDVTTDNAYKCAMYSDACHLFSLFDRFGDRLRGSRDIDDDAFTQAFAARAARPEQAQTSFRRRFGDESADFSGANINGSDYVIRHCSLSLD